MPVRRVERRRRLRCWKGEIAAALVITVALVVLKWSVEAFDHASVCELCVEVFFSCVKSFRSFGRWRRRGGPTMPCWRRRAATKNTVRHTWRRSGVFFKACCAKIAAELQKLHDVYDKMGVGEEMEVVQYCQVERTSHSGMKMTLVVGEKDCVVAQSHGGPAQVRPHAEGRAGEVLRGAASAFANLSSVCAHGCVSVVSDMLSCRSGDSRSASGRARLLALVLVPLRLCRLCRIGTAARPQG